MCKSQVAVVRISLVKSSHCSGLIQTAEESVIYLTFLICIICFRSLYVTKCDQCGHNVALGIWKYGIHTVLPLAFFFLFFPSLHYSKMKQKERADSVEQTEGPVLGSDSNMIANNKRNPSFLVSLFGVCTRIDGVTR